MQKGANVSSKDTFFFFFLDIWGSKVCIIVSIWELKQFRAEAEYRDKMDAFTVMVADSEISHWQHH